MFLIFIKIVFYYKNYKNYKNFFFLYIIYKINYSESFVFQRETSRDRDRPFHFVSFRFTSFRTVSLRSTIRSGTFTLRYAYGVRHKILKGIEKFYKEVKDPFYNAPHTGSLIYELDPSDTEYEMVKNEMLTSGTVTFSAKNERFTVIYFSLP